MAESKLPENLRGYKLKKVHHSFIGRLIIWIIIILVVLWFVNRQVVFDLYDWLRNIIVSFL
ncbi:hypothetical protein HYV89_03075 [Candidatus Woesearchaeota archaeon]|nr:hypothetical protein [Candidatus Woesearchaeota archaeon]